MEQNEVITKFHALKDLFCRVKEYDMWNYNMHLSLAYLIDRASNSTDFKQYYENLTQLAKGGKFSQLAWEVSLGIKNLFDIEPTADQNEKANMLQQLVNCQYYYQRNELCFYCFVSDKFAPVWFAKDYKQYSSSDAARRKNGVVEYIVRETGLDLTEAFSHYNQLLKYPDILNEYFYYTKYKEFKSFYPITAGNNAYTAKQIYESSKMTVLDAYLMLIKFRIHPRMTL